MDWEDNLIITLKMNQMQFTTTSQKAYILETNATGINIAKNQQNFFELGTTRRSSEHNKKAQC